MTRASQINNKCNQSDNADNLIFKRIGYRNGNLLFQLNITIHTPSTLYISLDFDSDKILPLPLLAGCCHDHNHCIQVTINVIVIWMHSHELSPHLILILGGHDTSQKMMTSFMNSPLPENQATRHLLKTRQMLDTSQTMYNIQATTKTSPKCIKIIS